MSYTNWIAFLMIALLTSTSPGPGAILTMSHAILHGWRNTILIIIGQELALTSIVFAAGAGAGILLSSPISLIILKIIGCSWLIYMGISKWFSHPCINSNNASTSIIPLPKKAYKRLLTGFLTDITNAKTIIFMIVTVPQFINLENEHLWQQVTVMALTMVITDTIMMNIYSFAASRLQIFFRNPLMIKKQNRFFGIILILLAFSLLFLTS